MFSWNEVLKTCRLSLKAGCNEKEISIRCQRTLKRERERMGRRWERGSTVYGPVRHVQAQCPDRFMM